MRFKLVPEPPATLDAVRRARRAVFLVPDDEDDCCARLMRRLDLPSRDVARTWLTFLRALELVTETPSGFRRTSTEPTPDRLRGAFLERVLFADTILSTLVETAAAAERSGTETEGSLDADAAFARTRSAVPTYERHKNPDSWESIWCDRTADVLGWLAVLDLATVVEGDVGDPNAAYVPTERGVDAVGRRRRP